MSFWVFHYIASVSAHITRPLGLRRCLVAGSVLLNNASVLFNMLNNGNICFRVNKYLRAKNNHFWANVLSKVSGTHPHLTAFNASACFTMTNTASTVTCSGGTGVSKISEQSKSIVRICEEMPQPNHGQGLVQKLCNAFLLFLTPPYYTMFTLALKTAPFSHVTPKQNVTQGETLAVIDCSFIE